MTNHRRLAAATLLCSLLFAACGDDGGETITQSVGATATTVPATTATPTSTAAPATTAAPTTAVAPATTAAPTDGASPFAAGSPEAAAAAAYRTVFDSTVGFDAKAPHLEDAAALKATVEQYTAAAARFGGFRLEPTAVSVTAATAAITYDVYFGTAPQYREQKGAVTNVNGAWQVSRADFCSFMQSARITCPA